MLGQSKKKLRPIRRNPNINFGSQEANESAKDPNLQASSHKVETNTHPILTFNNTDKVLKLPTIKKKNSVDQSNPLSRNKFLTGCAT